MTSQYQRPHNPGPRRITASTIGAYLVALIGIAILAFGCWYVFTPYASQLLGFVMIFGGGVCTFPLLGRVLRRFE